MSFATLLPLVLALGISFVPVWLLRRPNHGRAQDYFVSSGPTRPEVVRNASIAYALRMAAFGPLFAWGATRDLWPALIGSAFLGLGVYLIYILRRPLLEFLDGALSRDRSITVHEFIARQHGNDPRVRLLAASLTVFALLGLLGGEALAVAALLKPLLPPSAAVCLCVFGALLLTALHAIPSGHSGVMHSAQLQLGMLYLGLLGSTTLLLYLHVSALTPMPPHGTLALAVITVCCASMLSYRRSKYVDTAPIEGARLLSRFGKILNPCLSVLATLTIVVALTALYAAGLPAIVRDGAAALRTGTRVPGVGLLALCLLALFHPLVDVTNWQRLAAAAKDMGGIEPDRRSTVFRGLFRMYAVETALVWLFVGMLGAIALGAIDASGGEDPLSDFVAQLVRADNDVTAVVLALLLICACAAALSTMSALFSASLCTIRYDLLAASKEPTATRRSIVAGGALGLAVAAALCVADLSLQISFTGSTFLALLLAFCCAQLALAPLVLGPIVGRARGGSGAVSPGWALVVLGSGAASGLAAVTVYLATGTEAWLWAAVPACVGSGWALFVCGRAASRHPV
jgi:hypothetical protein